MDRRTRKLPINEPQATAVTKHQLQRSQLELGVGVLLAQFKAAVDKCISTVAYTVANKHVTLIIA